MLGITLEQAFFVFGRLCLPARAARGKNGVDLAGRFFLALHADDRQHAAGNIDADQIALSPQPRQLESGFVLAYGPVELDCTFPALFQEAYDQLRDAAGAILFAPAGAKEEP